jgi:ribonucleotide monophosphatase NagD (HAD superfamily)
MAREVGAAGILVLSGATSAEAVADAEVKPDYVLAGIHELLPPIERYAGVPT